MLVKFYSSREVIQILKKNGWVETGKATGSHHFLKHPQKAELGKIAVPHPKKDIPKGTLKAIFKQADIMF